jgi:hypothetical protein
MRTPMIIDERRSICMIAYGAPVPVREAEA